MKKIDVIRAWKDPFYRSTLTADELDQLPVHPAGPIEIRESDLKGIAAAAQTTAPECTSFTAYPNYRPCCPKH